MKYIMLQHRETKQKLPIIFPCSFSYSIMADIILSCPLYSPYYDVVNAGECTITCTSVSGGSTLHGLTFGDGDSEVIDMIDYHHGL